MENGRKGAKSGEGKTSERFTSLSRHVMVARVGEGVGVRETSRHVGDLFQRWNPKDMSLRWGRREAENQAWLLGRIRDKDAEGKGGF